MAGIDDWTYLNNASHVLHALRAALGLIILSRAGTFVFHTPYAGLNVLAQGPSRDRTFTLSVARCCKKGGLGPSPIRVGLGPTPLLC